MIWQSLLAQNREGPTNSFLSQRTEALYSKKLVLATGNVEEEGGQWVNEGPVFRSRQEMRPAEPQHGEGKRVGLLGIQDADSLLDWKISCLDM